MSLFDLATGKKNWIHAEFWPHTTLSRVQERVLDELLEGDKTTTYLISKMRVEAPQTVLKRLEEMGYIKFTGLDIWMLGDRGLDYLGQKIAALD